MISSIKIEIDNWFRDYISSFESKNKLVEAMEYSLLSGGQRIRPTLCSLTAQALQKETSNVIPLGCAIEMIHTYSLIHDDLPCMDNDDFRRGKPSNHKVFGEAVAILAGDALLTEAFRVLESSYGSNPTLALRLVRGLAEASSVQGLVGGQALDLLLREKTLTKEELQQIHLKKTGALLRFSVLGAAEICGATEAQKNILDRYASALGLVFQIADDIADGASTDEPNIVNVVGRERAQKICEDFVKTAQSAIKDLAPASKGLNDMAQFVYERAL